MAGLTLDGCVERLTRGGTGLGLVRLASDSSLLAFEDGQLDDNAALENRSKAMLPNNAQTPLRTGSLAHVFVLWLRAFPRAPRGVAPEKMPPPCPHHAFTLCRGSGPTST